MRIASIAFLGFFLLPGTTWHTDFEHARKEASENHRYIMVNFSESDWCKPCIRMNKEIFESAEFREYAAENLVLVNADFPQKKKNQLPQEQCAKNESLAAQYNPQRIFPYTVLLDDHGKLIAAWKGFPEIQPSEFIAQVRKCKGGR